MVDEFNSQFPGVEGLGVTAAVFDHGAVRATHREFRKSGKSKASRVTVLTRKEVSEHSTHVAGIMAASGGEPRAKGMAPALSLISLDWDDDFKTLSALAPRLQISNHSYARPGGWERRGDGWHWLGDEAIDKEEDALFGKYSSRASEFDAVLRRFPSLLAVVPIGNDRSDTPFEKLVQHYARDGRRVTDQPRKPDNWDRGGLDTATELCVAKNTLCVGAIEDIALSTDIAVEHYSGWGPTDDGRVKPDLVASGSNILSASSLSDTAYGEMSGTAVATPVVSGIAALLAQLYRRERGGAQARFPTAAELKAILIHTATNAGEPGPDPIFGWGAINAHLAGRVIAQKDAAGAFRHLIISGRATASRVSRYTLVPQGEEVKVTLVWTDPEAPANGGGLDDPMPTLQNDLDVRLIPPDGQVLYPYSLDPSNPLAPARADRPNRLDNVEVIEFAGVRTDGSWQLEVNAKSLRSGKSQPFALVVSWFKGSVAPAQK